MFLDSGSQFICIVSAIFWHHHHCQNTYLEKSWFAKKGWPVFTLNWMMSFKSCSSFSWLTRSADNSRSISFWSSSGALHSTTRLVLLVAWNTAFSSIRSTASFRNWECCFLSGRLANQDKLVPDFSTFPGGGEREETSSLLSAVTFSYDPEISCFLVPFSRGWENVMTSAEAGIFQTASRPKCLWNSVKKTLTCDGCCYGQAYRPASLNV